MFDPKTGIFASLGTMSASRSYQTATLLKNGKVLVAGGRDNRGNVLATAEIFEPTNGKFIPAGSMRYAREFHTTTLLSDGLVLIIGGDDGSTALATAEVFDPGTGRFKSVGSMQQALEFHTATLRNDGTMLVVGGNALISGTDGGAHAGLVPESKATAELFDPSSGSFHSAGEMSNPRAKHTATLLPDGTVVIIGGALSESFARSFFLSSAELFQ